MHTEEAKIYPAILIAVFGLAVILTLFIISLLRQQKKMYLLNREKVNAEITTLERERNRIARDLHDDVAVVLSVSKLKLSCIENVSAVNHDLLNKAMNNIDDALVKIREILNDLMPGTFIRKGLVAALKELFNTINEADKFSIEYDIQNDFLNLPEDQQLHLFRAIQEIIYNSIKHSNGSVIKFNLTQEKSCIKIFISDNGIGFNQQKTLGKKNGLGLNNIVSRIEMLKGNVYLESAEGKGVSYTLEIPLA